MRTVPVQIVCRKCGNPFRTTVRGGNTRCPHCKASRHVRLNQEWEGPIPASLSAAEARAQEVARRPPVWLECLHCDHEWQSQAKDQTVLHCPSCHAGKRVPRRTAENTGAVPPSRMPLSRPSPAEYRPEPSRRLRAAPAELYGDDYEEEEQTAPLGLFQALGRASRPLGPPTAPGALGGLFGALFGRPAAPAAPRAPESSQVLSPAPLPAPAPPVRMPTPARSPAGPPRTTRGPAPDPVAVSTLPAAEVKRRDTVCQIVRATGATAVLVWYNQPPGVCEVLDASQPRDKQRCPERAAYAVRFVMGDSEGHAYACAAHVGLLASVAEGAEYVSATIHRA